MVILMKTKQNIIQINHRLIRFQSTQDNSNLFQQLKSGLKRTINWNNYQPDPKTWTKPIFKLLS